MSTALAVQPQQQLTKIDQGKDEDYYDVTRLKRQYQDYASAKEAEAREMVESRHYYHGDQWTARELSVLKSRRQPPTTENQIVKKVNGVIGLIERLRQDPKAYARTPKHDEGAELATATLRFVLDNNDWKSKSSRIAGAAAIDGIAGIEYDLVPGDEGDPSLEMHITYGDGFFYDPRSVDEGFTDARFLGVSKPADAEMIKELVPDRAAEIDTLFADTGSDMTTIASQDRDKNWNGNDRDQRKLQLVDHWYIKGGKWRWCLYVGNTMLIQGISPFVDEKGKSFPRYRMFSTAVDHDGDRYGFNRNLKSPQDQLNHFNSKKSHIANTRRIISEKGAVDDIEVARREWARPDGWIEKNPGLTIEPDQTTLNDFKGLAELAIESRTYLENFGPNPSLIGQGLEDSSGRAIQLLQQAAIAELGPYLGAFKNWKIRVYRDIWNIIQRYWTAERWIRVTDDQNIAQFFQINQTKNPDTGQPHLDEYGRPVIVNAIGSLDVDIIIDEGPDAVNLQADSMMVLQSLGPQFLQQFPDIALELSPLPNSVKKPMLDKIKQQQSQPPQPDPSVMAAQQKAQLDQQVAEQNAQREAQQAQEESQRKQVEFAADQQREAQKAAFDRQQKQEQAAFDFHLEEQKAAHQMEIEEAKANHQLTMAGRKADQDIGIAKQKGEINATNAANKAEKKKPKSDPVAQTAVEALKALASHMEEIKEISKAPRKLIRDAQGRPQASVIG